MKIEQLENCPNCGGILNETGRCQFCGSKVYDFLAISFGDPRSPSYAKTYIRIKVENRIGILPVYPQAASLKATPRFCRFDTEEGVNLRRLNTVTGELTVEFTILDLDSVIWYKEEQPDGIK